MEIKRITILGTTVAGVAFVGRVEAWEGSHHERDILTKSDELRKDPNNFIVVHEPVLHLEFANPKNARQIQVGLRSVYMTLEVDTWNVKLAGYLRLNEKTHAKLIGEYEKFLAQERAARAGLELASADAIPKEV